MSNVLPVQAQQNLWRMQRARFVMVFAGALCVLAFIALLALVPSFAALEANTVSPGDVAARGGTVADALKSMIKTQSLLNAVTPILASTSSPEGAIEHALSLRPKGVSVDHIMFVSASKQIQLSGTASREALNAFRTALQADPSYSSVAMPVGALFDSNGQYTVTLTGAF